MARPGRPSPKPRPCSDRHEPAAVVKARGGPEGGGGEAGQVPAADAGRRIETQVREPTRHDEAGRLDRPRRPRCDRAKVRRPRAGRGSNELQQKIAKAERVPRSNWITTTAEIEQKEKLMRRLAEEIERLKVELEAPPRVTLAEEPFVVTGIEGNRRLKFALLAGVGVFVLGFAGLVGWEHRSRRVTHTDEVSTDLGVRLLGHDPAGRARRAGRGPTRSSWSRRSTPPGPCCLHGTPAAAAADRPGHQRGRRGGEDDPGRPPGDQPDPGRLPDPAGRRRPALPVRPPPVRPPRRPRAVRTAPRARSGRTPRSARPPSPGCPSSRPGQWDLATRQALVGDRWRQVRSRSWRRSSTSW